MVLTLVIAVLFGACLGSFVTTAALRSLTFEPAILGRSRCDTCRSPLGFAATTPVVSYFALGGACSACGARIDPAHTAGELAGAMIAGAAFTLAEPFTATLLTVLGLVLLAASVIDHKSQRLPDMLTLVAAALALTLVAFGGKDRLIVGLICAAASFVLLEALRRGFDLARGRSGLGFGDVKLLSVLAIWLGVTTPWVVALASVAGLATVAIVRPADGRIAFGPLIAGAAMMVGLALEGGLFAPLGYAP